MAILIDGRELARKLKAEIKAEVDLLGIQPGLAVVRVGDDPASEIYVGHKHRACESVGFKSWNHHLPATATQEEVLTLVDKLNEDESVHGILVQLPLPDHLDRNDIIETIDPQKDVDGLHPLNAGRMMIEDPFLVPCTPQGCLDLIRSVEKNLSGLKAVIIGRSNLVGKPLIPLLLQENCTVTTVHSKTKNIKDECRTADILIAAAGRAQLVKADWVKKRAIVIDVGISREGDHIVGDVDTDEVAKVAKAVTPVPGGVGPMTVAYLLKNTLKAALNFQE